MASNKRGGLSKGELKRAQAAKARPVVKKVPVRSVVKKNNSLSGGSVTNTSSRPTSNYMDTEGYTEKMYNALPATSAAKVSAASGAGDRARAIARENVKKRSSGGNSNSNNSPKPKTSNRSLASKALGILTGASTAQAADSAPTVNTTPQRNLVPTKVKSGLGRSLGYAKDIASDVIGILPGIGLPAQQLIKRAPDLGATETLGLNKYLQKDSGMAFDPESQPYIDAFNAEANRQDFSPTVENLNQTRKNTNIIKNYQNRNINPFESEPFQGPNRIEPTKNNYDKTNDNQIDTEGYTNDIFNGALTENNPASYVNPADAPLQDLPGGTQRSRSGRGSGLFATGKGVGNPAGPEDEYLSGRGSGLFATGKGVGNPAGPEDEYLSMLRKSMKGYGQQEDDVMRQFKNLIKALDPTYDEYQKEGQKTLEQELQRNLTQLAAVMNSNNTGDSEQRAQMMAGLQRDNQNSLGDLVRKLMLQKNEDINKYKSQSVEAVNSVRDKQMSARERYAQALKDYKQQQFENQYKMSSLGSRGGGSSKANYKQVGVDASGQPVFRDFNTGEQWVGNGLKANYDPLDAIYERLGQNQSQGGSWEIDPITNERVWVTNN